MEILINHPRRTSFQHWRRIWEFGQKSILGNLRTYDFQLPLRASPEIAPQPTRQRAVAFTGLILPLATEPQSTHAKMSTRDHISYPSPDKKNMC